MPSTGTGCGVWALPPAFSRTHMTICTQRESPVRLVVGDLLGPRLQPSAGLSELCACRTYVIVERCGAVMSLNGSSPQEPSAPLLQGRCPLEM